MQYWRQILALVLFSPAGCVTTPENPSFPVTVEHAEWALAEMAKTPHRAQRPIVIIGGYLDFGLGPWGVQQRLAPEFSDALFIPVAVPFQPTFDGCRRKVIAAVDRACRRGGDSTQTAEVDVIGISMGGLVARYAAMPLPGRRRLQARRIFTISSPLQGAKLAVLPTFDRKQMAMRRGSKFLRQLADAEPEEDYELIPYVRLGDEMVGEENAAPVGRTPWWVPNRLFEAAHALAATDPRILADIARRLRGEEPFTTTPPAPLPVAEEPIEPPMGRG